MNWLSYIVPQTVARMSSRYNPDIRVLLESGKYKLLVNGSRESGEYIGDLWKYAMSHLKFASQFPIRNILVLGVAGGTVIHLLRGMFPHSEITGVDIDKQMIEIGKRYFGLSDIDSLKLVVSDAKEFVPKQKKNAYDLVVLDLFIGREIPQFASSVDFLQSIRNILTPHGRLFINFLREEEYGKKADLLSKRLGTLFTNVRSVDRYNNRFFLADGG